MRRAIAVMVFLNFVSLTSGITLFGDGPSCCCSMKSGRACPLRAHCSAGGSCSMASQGMAVEQRMPRAVAESAYRVERVESARTFVPIAALLHDACSNPPDVPPPRAA